MVPHEVVTPVRRQGQSHLQCKLVGAFLQTTSIFSIIPELTSYRMICDSVLGSECMGKAICQNTLAFYIIWNSRKKHTNAVNTGDCSVSGYSHLSSFL